MDIVITGRHTEVPDRFRKLVEEKLAKVGALAPKAQRADVEWSHERNPRQSATCEKVEITLRGKGPVIRAEASAEDPTAALDIALGKLGERLRRTRDRRKVHHGRQTPPSVRAPGAAEVAAVVARSAHGRPASRSAARHHSDAGCRPAPGGTSVWTWAAPRGGLLPVTRDCRVADEPGRGASGEKQEVPRGHRDHRSPHRGSRQVP